MNMQQGTRMEQERQAVRESHPPGINLHGGYNNFYEILDLLLVTVNDFIDSF